MRSRNPARTMRGRRWKPDLHELGRSAVRLRPRARAARGIARRSRRDRAPHPRVDRPRPGAERRHRGLGAVGAEPAPGARLLVHALVGQAVRLLRDVGTQGAGRGRARRDRVRRTRGDRGRARDPRDRQPEQPARLGRAHGRRADSVGVRQAARARDPVPARRRDRARLGRRRARPPDRRGAVGRGARPADEPGSAGRLRLVLLGDRHAKRRTGLRHSGVRARDARRRPARPALRPAVPRAAAASARRTPSTRRRPTRPSMSLWATFMAGSDIVMHAAGWLEGGLVSSHEKLVLDLELLRMFTLDRRGPRGRRGAPRARRDPRDRPGRDVPRVDAHARALPRVVVPQPALPLAGVPDVAEARRAALGRGRAAGLEGPPRELRGSRARREHGRARLREYIDRRTAELDA